MQEAGLWFIIFANMNSWLIWGRNVPVIVLGLVRDSFVKIPVVAEICISSLGMVTVDFSENLQRGGWAHFVLAFSLRICSVDNW